MSLVRHIAGIPTATQQRCIRCCEVIVRAPNRPYWQGDANVVPLDVPVGDGSITNCTPYDDRPPLTVDGVKEALEILKRELKAEVMEHPERAL